MGGIAENIGPLKAKVHQAVNDVSVVELPTPATVGIGVPHLFAQGAVWAGLHEWLPGGNVERNLSAVRQFLAVGVGGI